MFSGDGPEPAFSKHEDSLPVEIRGAKRQLTEMLAKWQRQARGLVALNNIARVVVSSQDLSQILAVAVREIQESLGVRGAQVILVDPGSRQFIYHGLAGVEGILPASQGGEGLRDLVSQVIQSGRSIRNAQASDTAGWAPSSPARATLCVPLLVSDRVVGAFQVTDKLQHRVAGKAVPFDEQDQEVLEGVAAFVAMAVENARLQEQTRVQAASQVLQATVVTLSHYVNNPLQGLVAAAELLRERFERLPQDEDVTAVAESDPLGLLDVIIDNAQAISAVLCLLQDVGLPESTTYVGSQQMLDIESELQARMEAIQT